MNIKEVKELIQEILQSDIGEFELEQTGTKIKIKRGFHQEIGAPAVNPAHSSPQVYISHTAPVSAPTFPDATQEAADEGLHFIASPIVGTFYRAASPGAEPYVSVGDKVSDGTVLCIVEAMKLMNEIPSDAAGEIVHIYVENGHPVEFGQKLFGIRPRK